jgi:integrase
MQMQTSSARRTKVAKRPGIYYRDTVRGRRYEITFVDERGVRRWQTLDGNLEAAQAALDERRRRKRGGEPVAPEKVRLSEFADSWLAGQTQLKPGTRKLYGVLLDKHVKPRLGRVWLHEIREDDVTGLISDMRGLGYSPHTIRAVLTPLGRALNTAVRRRLIPSNPMTRLERGERPSPTRRETRMLSTEEIGRLLDAASPLYRPLIATALFTGVRQGELLGLSWGDVDFDAGLVRVRRQLARDGSMAPPKTPQAVREIVLMPALARLLLRQRELAFARGLAGSDDLVFASGSGGPFHYRNVARRGLDKAMDRAGLIDDGKPRLRWHDLRHTFASVLIAQGSNVLFVSRQLGHSTPTVTLDTYGHLFDREEHGQRMRDGLEAAFGNALETAGGEPRRTASGGEAPNVARLAGSA